MVLGQELHQCHFFSVDILLILFIVYLPKLLIPYIANIEYSIIDINPHPHQPQIFTDIYLMIFIHSLFSIYGLRFSSVPGIIRHRVGEDTKKNKD